MATILHATGIIQITPDPDNLTLLNPSLEVMNVLYGINANSVILELQFTENGGVHLFSRNFEYSNPTGGDLGWADILAYINNDPVLKVFS